MWRNVFGHFIYQAIVLIVVIFLGQRWFVHNYSASCFTFDATDPKVCTKWNPYYLNAGELYYEEKDLGFWKSKKLSSSDFDATFLDDLSCDAYL